MKLFKRLLVCVLAVAMVLSMAACDGNDSTTTPETSSPATSEPTSESGQTLNVMVEVEVASLDPQVATDVPALRSLLTILTD